MTVAGQVKTDLGLVVITDMLRLPSAGWQLFWVKLTSANLARNSRKVYNLLRKM